MHVCLHAIAGSEWATQVVLRGSVALRAQLGDAAREPGDVDLVVIRRPWRTTRTCASS
ncbi:hypothetical protein [Catenuloplanes niger]